MPNSYIFLKSNFPFVRTFINSFLEIYLRHSINCSLVGYSEILLFLICILSSIVRKCVCISVIMIQFLTLVPYCFCELQIQLTFKICLYYLGSKSSQAARFCQNTYVKCIFSNCLLQMTYLCSYSSHSHFITFAYMSI